MAPKLGDTVFVRQYDPFDPDDAGTVSPAIVTKVYDPATDDVAAEAEVVQVTVFGPNGGTDSLAVAKNRGEDRDTGYVTSPDGYDAKALPPADPAPVQAAPVPTAAQPTPGAPVGTVESTPAAPGPDTAGDGTAPQGQGTTDVAGTV